MGKTRKSKGAGSADAPGRAQSDGWEKRGTQRVTAMSHPLRARCLRLLVERDVMSPSELSHALKAPLSDVSYHVRRLEELECAELVSTRPVRGAVEHFYRAIERHLVDTDEFHELDPIVAEDVVCDSFQRVVDDFVASRKAEMVGFDSEFHLTRTPLILDIDGYREGLDAVERCRLELSEIERKSAERRDKSGAPSIRLSASLLFYRVPHDDV